MNLVILKYSVGPKNYWGNEVHPDGVGLQTLASITQTVIDVACAGGSIYVCKAGPAPVFFGPMSCEPEIVHERGAFYRLRLTGNLGSRAALALPPAVATRVQRFLPMSEGVLVRGRWVQASYFNHPQPAELDLRGAFSVTRHGV